MTEPPTILSAVARRLWARRDGSGAVAGGAGIVALRIAFAVVRDIVDGRLSLRAASLVYSTLLSLVPMLAFSFSVLKGFGVHNQLEPALKSVLVPLGPQAAEITSLIIEFVDRVQVGVLGAVGLGVLVFTVVSLIEKVEAAFNELWCVEDGRPLLRRLPEYLTALLIGPVLVFSMAGGFAAVTQFAADYSAAGAPGIGTALAVLLAAVPVAATVVFFAGLYGWLPNRPVTLRAAAIGGLTATCLWIAGGWLFGLFVASSAQYAAIYSAFATAMVLMIWIYAAWLIVLVGCDVAFYFQNPAAARFGRQPPGEAPQIAERLALLVFREIALAFHDGRPPPTADNIVGAVLFPQSAVGGTLDRLATAGLIVATAGDGPGHLPARPLETIPVASIIDAARRDTGRLGDDGRAAPLEARISLAIAQALDGLTAVDLIGPPGDRAGGEEAPIHHPPTCGS